MSRHGAILVGGEIGWNGPSCADMWAYDVQKNTWATLQPQYKDSKAKVNFRENLMTGYDTRYNVVVFRSSGTMWAYRYAK